MDCWMPTRTRCWLELKNRSCSSATRWSSARVPCKPMDSISIAVPSCPFPRMCASSQKLPNAVQHGLSAAPEDVSYSVARAMTLAAPHEGLNAAAPAAIGNLSLRICDARTDPMLASEDESRALAALRFSLASDIVELVVLTADEAFLQTLREGVGAARRLWHVLSPDKISDLLVAGGVGILVLDVQALNEAAARFVADIKHQFPDLVIVVAGNRESETELARLISDGSS